MGTFGGHALPGSFFIYFALNGIYHALKMFYQRRAFELNMSVTESPKFHNRISNPVKLCSSGCCKDRAILLNSWLKVTFCLIGIAGEVITGFDADWHFKHIGNAQHCTMYSGFAIAGIVELCIYHGLAKLPIATEYVFNCVAMLSEGFLFLFHLHGRTPLDVYIHMLLAGMIITSIVAGVGGLISPNEPVFGLVMWWTVLMQGTWFWQVGAMLYPPFNWLPEWDGNLKQSIPRAANLFCYHMLFNMLIIVVIAIGMSLRLGRLNMNTVTSRLNLLNKSHVAGAHNGVVLHDDTNSFIESDETELWAKHAVGGETDEDEIVS